MNYECILNYCFNFLLNYSSFNSLQPCWIVVSSYHWIGVSILWIILNYHCFNFSLNECFNSSQSYSIDILILTYKNTNTIQKLNNTDTMHIKKFNFNFEQFGCHNNTKRSKDHCNQPNYNTSHQINRSPKILKYLGFKPWGNFGQHYMEGKWTPTKLR